MFLTVAGEISYRRRDAKRYHEVRKEECLECLEWRQHQKLSTAPHFLPSSPDLPLLNQRYIICSMPVTQITFQSIIFTIIDQLTLRRRKCTTFGGYQNVRTIIHLSFFHRWHSWGWPYRSGLVWRWLHPSLAATAFEPQSEPITIRR